MIHSFKDNAMYDAVGELMWLNGYSYANGNPVNLTDHDGLCPRRDGGLEARECEFLRDDLRAWKVDVVYDIGRDVLDPGLCGLPSQCDEAVNQAQGVRQRFTLGEMSAIHNAVQIFRAAQGNIGFAGLQNMITIEKRFETSQTDVQKQMALGLTVGHTITLSARWWGEGDASLPTQGKANQPRVSTVMEISQMHVSTDHGLFYMRWGMYY